jgi:hypothetical protein
MLAPFTTSCCNNSKNISGRIYHYGIPIPPRNRPIDIEEPYGWQTEIINLLKDKPDKRTIHWYWEDKGNVGKTTLCKYLVIKLIYMRILMMILMLMGVYMWVWCGSKNTALYASTFYSIIILKCNHSNHLMMITTIYTSYMMRYNDETDAEDDADTDADADMWVWVWCGSESTALYVGILCNIII